MNSSFRELFYPSPPNPTPISFRFPGSPNGIFFPRLCSCPTSMYCCTRYCSLLGNYKHKKCTNTTKLGTVAVAEHPSFTKHNRTAHPESYSRGRASNFSLKTYNLRSYFRSQDINLRLSTYHDRFLPYISDFSTHNSAKRQQSSIIYTNISTGVVKNTVSHTASSSRHF